MKSAQTYAPLSQPGDIANEPGSGTNERHDEENTTLLTESFDDDGSDKALSAGGSAERQTGLRKALGVADGVAIVIGIIIGTGIFASPGVVMASSGSVWLGLVAWGIAGTLATASSLVYCELGAMIPQAGGDYNYLDAAFGPGW
eukprot:SAG31_NODE_12145_length_964_cov_1.473988_1_plen_144_part_00